MSFGCHNNVVDYLNDIITCPNNVIGCLNNGTDYLNNVLAALIISLA